MSIQERISLDVKNKLLEIKQTDNGSVETTPDVSDYDEQVSIESELLKQAALETDSQEGVDDFFQALSGPMQEDGNEKLVGVEYMGRVGYIDISFETLNTDLSEEAYNKVLHEIEVVAFTNDSAKVKRAVKEIEKLGDQAIEIIFRECRKFDLTNERKRNEIVQLLGRLTIRSLKARRIVKAVLEYATSSQHIKLAILTAGTIRDREVVDLLLEHAKNPLYFELSCDALLKIRNPKVSKPLIQIIQNIDVARKDLIDQAFLVGHRFHEFGSDAVLDVYTAYVESKHQLRSIFSVALRSFKEDAIPVLSKMLEQETDAQKLLVICKPLGALRQQYSTMLLLQALDKYPDKKVAIVEGLSHTQDPSIVPVLLKELEGSTNYKVQQKCLNAIAFLGNQEHVPAIQKYLDDPNHHLYLDALMCMVRFGDESSFEKYIQIMIDGDNHQQFVLERHTTKLPFPLLTKLAQKLLVLPDEQAMLIVATLQRLNVLPREVGPVLRQLLNRKLSTGLRLEIYRLVGKHANTKKELLSQDIIYEAREAESNPRIKRELEQIISNMKQEKGHVSAIRDRE